MRKYLGVNRWEEEEEEEGEEEEEEEEGGGGGGGGGEEWNTSTEMVGRCGKGKMGDEV